MNAPIPENEARRLVALRRYQILDTAAEQAFDDIVKVAAFIFETPMAMISLVDEQRQWFKAKIGLTATETPREQAFCAHTILQHEVMMVEDATLDARFADNPLVTGGPNIRFYAGAPLVSPEGLDLGALCVLDRKAHKLDQRQKEVLQSLARMVMTTMELRRISSELVAEIERAKTLGGLLPICSHCKSIRNDEGYWQRVEKYVEEHSTAHFTHSYCPDCFKLYFPEITQEEYDSFRKK